LFNSCGNGATADLLSALGAQSFSWRAGMTDKERPRTETHDKRELAALVRRVAATMSLKADRDALLAQAAAIEAEAERIERAQRE
jgi:hypothetical protein